MTGFATNTRIEMRLAYRWLGTSAAPTVEATITGARPNVFGGTTYKVEFTAPKLMNGKPMQVMRLLTDLELDKQFVREIPPVKKARKAAKPKTVARSGRAA